jgi:hypothetical protein
MIDGKHIAVVMPACNAAKTLERMVLASSISFRSSCAYGLGVRGNRTGGFARQEPQRTGRAVAAGSGRQ